MHSFDKTQNRCVPKQQNRKPIRCRYQYNSKTRSCKVLTKECNLQGYYSSNYRKCIPRCPNGQSFDGNDSCR